MITTFVYFRNYFYQPEAQIGFRDPATALLEQIIELHHLIFAFVLLISALVMWLLMMIIDNYLYIYCYGNQKPKKLGKEEEIGRIPTNDLKSSFLIHTFGILQKESGSFKEDQLLEALWTILPALLLIEISVPSFYMLYLSEESIETLLTVKAIGFQWYWTYDFTDLFPFWYNLKTSELDIDDYLIESYMEPTEFLSFSEGDLRLLETDNILLLPTNVHLRLIVTSMDTLHSFAVPSLGIKIDAVPGRLNKLDIFIYRMGVFYGQCSEICGIGHAFMPICVFAVAYLNFLLGSC